MNKEELKRRLKENQFDRRKNCATWEKLDTTKLHLIGLDKNIFLKKVKWTWKKYACEILLDVSWSMFPGKNNYIKDAVESLINIIKFLYWVVDINVVMYDYVERRVRFRDVFSIKLNMLNMDWDSAAMELWQRIKTVTNGNVKSVVPDEWWFRSSGGNREIINIVNAAERLNNMWSDWDKCIILIGDWDMNLDNHGWRSAHEQDKDLIIAWKSVKKYNPDTAADVVKNLWMPVLWIWLWTHQFSYIEDTCNVYNPSNSSDAIIKFFTKHFM